MSSEKLTDDLMNVLKSAKPSDIAEFLDENPEDEKAFSSYMREMFKKKGIRQQEVFTRMGISYGYGYKLISGEKKTRQRDLIIELCLCAGFTLEEAQRALRLYGMASLYPKKPRDAVLIIAFNQGISDIGEVDKLLNEHGMDELYKCAER